MRLPVFSQAPASARVSASVDRASTFKRVCRHGGAAVDSVAEGETTVGVEWHVEVGDTPFPLG
eukprot:1815532-Pleurochrysis_carterae.AAC.1